MRVAVVGAGVLGASTAFHAACAGAEVVLIDAGVSGSATAAGAGIVSPWLSEIDDPDWHRLATAGARYYPELVDRLAQDGETNLGYRRCGTLAVSTDQHQLAGTERRVRARCLALPEAGEISRLPGGEARALFPLLRDGFAAIHVSGGARVDGRLLAASLARAAAKRGAVVRTGTARLMPAAGTGVAGVAVGDESIEADAVVLAAGAWAPDLLAPIGVRLAVQPQRGQIVHLAVPDRDTSGWPVVWPLDGYYLVAFDDHRIVVGATRETGAGFDYRVTAGGQAEVLQAGLAVAPGLAGATVIETRVGFRPMGPDAKPMLGRIAGLGGVLIGNGLGHSGLTFGPYAGRLLAQAALGQPPELDLSAYGVVLSAGREDGGSAA